MKQLDGAIFAYDREFVILRVGYYEDRSIALNVETATEPVGKLTVCLPGSRLGSREVLVKTWSENQNLARAALGSKIFEDTGKRIATGYTEAQVWRVSEDYDFPTREGGVDFEDEDDDDYGPVDVETPLGARMVTDEEIEGLFDDMEASEDEGPLEEDEAMDIDRFESFQDDDDEIEEEEDE